MIDTVELTWGSTLGTAERRARKVAEPAAPPVYLDWSELVERHGSPNGEVQRRLYGDETNRFEQSYGQWKIGDVGMLYRDGRLELRASLPKLVAGRNDVVLDERGVHEGLRRLVSIGSELSGRPLELREATPSRLDYVYGWEVPSVAFTVEHLRAAFPPGRRVRTENVSPLFGGRSIVWGYGGKRVDRFYDKGAECAETAYRARELEPLGLAPGQFEGLADELRRAAIASARRRVREDARRTGFAFGFPLDTNLRFEVQDRRRPQLRLLHENGYRGADVERQLRRSVAALGAAALRDVDALIDSYGNFRFAFAFTMAALHLAEHDELWPLARRRLSRSSFYRWRQRAREAALAVGEWAPAIPDGAFTASSSLWHEEQELAA